MNITEVSFLVDRKKTYSKEFGIAKTQIKESDFKKDTIENIIKPFIDNSNVKSVLNKIDNNTILVVAPSVKRGKKINIIPEIYGEYLSNISGTPLINLNDYLSFKNSKSNRETYTAKERASNLFSYKFKDNKSLALYDKATKGKNIILVDDVITTGETIVHLGNYLRKKFPTTQIIGGTALVSNGARKPSTRDAWRFADKISTLIQDKIPIQELHKTIGEHFSNYTRLKMTRFERGVNSPKMAYAAINLMQTDNTRIKQSLRKSLEHIEKFPNHDSRER